MGNERESRISGVPIRRWPLAPIDLLALLALGSGIALIVSRYTTVLHYQWDWLSLGGAVLHWDPTHRTWDTGLLLRGFLATVRLSVWSSILMGLFGAVFAFCRISGSVYLRLVGGTYVGFVRNMPLLVFLFLFYFVLSGQLFPLLGLDNLGRGMGPIAARWVTVFFGSPQELPAFVTGAICLALFEGAYVAEILRAGLQAVPRGQWEAALSLGLSRRAALWRVVAPQAVRESLPALAGQVILLIKASSVASLISIPELTYMANEISSSNNHVFETWIAAAGLYLFLCFGCATVFSRLERRALAGIHPATRARA